MLPQLAASPQTTIAARATADDAANVRRFSRRCCTVGAVWLPRSGGCHRFPVALPHSVLFFRSITAFVFGCLFPYWCYTCSALNILLYCCDVLSFSSLICIFLYFLHFRRPQEGWSAQVTTRGRKKRTRRFPLGNAKPYHVLCPQPLRRAPPDEFASYTWGFDSKTSGELE